MNESDFDDPFEALPTHLMQAHIFPILSCVDLKKLRSVAGFPRSKFSVSPFSPLTSFQCSLLGLPIAPGHRSVGSRALRTAVDHSIHTLRCPLPLCFPGLGRNLSSTFAHFPALRALRLWFEPAPTAPSAAAAAAIRDELAAAFQAMSDSLPGLTALELWALPAPLPLAPHALRSLTLSDCPLAPRDLFALFPPTQPLRSLQHLSFRGCTALHPRERSELELVQQFLCSLTVGSDRTGGKALCPCLERLEVRCPTFTCTIQLFYFRRFLRIHLKSYIICFPHGINTSFSVYIFSLFYSTPFIDKRYHHDPQQISGAGQWTLPDPPPSAAAASRAHLAFFFAGPSLRHFALHNTHHVLWLPVPLSIGNSFALESFSVADCSTFSDLALLDWLSYSRALSSCAASLQSLDLSRTAVTDAAVAHALQCLPAMTTLSLRGAEGVTDASLVLIAETVIPQWKSRMRREDVSLDGAEEGAIPGPGDLISEEEFEEARVKLAYLDLRDCIAMSAASVLQFLRQVQDYCRDVQSASLESGRSKAVRLGLDVDVDGHEIQDLSVDSDSLQLDLILAQIFL